MMFDLVGETVALMICIFFVFGAGTITYYSFNSKHREITFIPLFLTIILIGVSTVISVDIYKQCSNPSIEQMSEEEIYQLGLQYEDDGEYLEAMKCFIDVYNYKEAEYHFRICTKLNLMKEERKRSEASENSTVH